MNFAKLLSFKKKKSKDASHTCEIAQSISLGFCIKKHTHKRRYLGVASEMSEMSREHICFSYVSNVSSEVNQTRSSRSSSLDAMMSDQDIPAWEIKRERYIAAYRGRRRERDPKQETRRNYLPTAKLSRCTATAVASARDKLQQTHTESSRVKFISREHRARTDDKPDTSANQNRYDTYVDSWRWVWRKLTHCTGGNICFDCDK